MTIAAHVFIQTLRRIRAARPEDVRHYQAVMLARLVDFAHRLVPAHAEALKPLIEDDGVALEHWERIPVMARGTLASGDPALELTERPEALGELSPGRPAAMTGAPLAEPVDEDFLWADACCYELLYEALKLDGRGVAVELRAPERIDPADPKRSGWSFQRMRGVAHLVDATLPLPELAAVMAAPNPVALIGDIGDLQRLAAAGFALPETITKIVAHGLAPMAGLELLRIWAGEQGREIGMILSLPETGAFAMMGPDGVIRACDGVVFTEIVDARGRPVSDGWPGRLVVTPLYAFTRPVLRLDTGLRAMRPADVWNGLRF